MADFEVIGLDHIVLRCADVEKSLAFYCDTLGLEPVRVDEWRDGAAPFPSVRCSPTTIVDLVAEPPDGSNMAHFCLVVRGVDADGLEARFPDGSRLDGLYGAQGYASSVYVQDPDGNTVELRSYA
ncbi:MAG: dioxygenase [Acidimicrobiia bacterium]|nr:MAG: dioxygenase [Acidimicrobiia bacterium]